MKIFISHGHHEVAKLQLKDFLQRTGHVAVILGEQPGRQGLTIIESLERFSVGCEFAIILLTADDVTSDGGRRARQNVIHEIGFFQGRLTRARVILIVQFGVEIPSNLSGLFYLEYKDELREVFDDLRVVLDSGNASTSAHEFSGDEWQVRKERFDRYFPAVHAFLKEIIDYKLQTHHLLADAKDTESQIKAIHEIDECGGRLYAAYLASRHFLDEALLERTEQASNKLAESSRARSRAQDSDWLHSHMDDAVLDYNNYLVAFDEFVETISGAFARRADHLRI